MEIQPTSSQTSIGLGNDQEEVVEDDGPDIRFTTGEKVRDTSFYTIKCKHEKTLLFWMKDKTALSLPHVDIDWSEKLVSGCVVLQRKIFDYIEGSVLKRTHKSIDSNKITPFIETPSLIGTTRIQMTDQNRPNKCLSIYVWIAKWKDNETIKCCQKTDQFEWFPINDIILDVSKIPVWGPEVKYWTKTDERLLRTPNEFNEITERYIFRLLSCRPDSDKEMDRQLWQSLHDTEVDRKVLIKLWTHFISHCFPSLNMSEIAFKHYLKRMADMSDTEIKRHFRAITSKTVIEFDEFVSELVARDPKSPQNQWRIGYIFRYYDLNSDKFLDREDIRGMVTDIIQAKEAIGQDIDKEVDRIMKICDEDKISFDKFCSKVLSNEIKDTSVIYRSQQSIHEIVLNRKVDQQNTKQKEQIRNDRDCPKHRSNIVSYCTNIVRIGGNGRLIDSKDIQISNANDIEFRDESTFIKNLRKHSIEMTNKVQSFPNQIIRVIRDFVKKVQTIKSEPQIKDINNKTINILNSTVVEKVCETVEQLFRNENRVLKLQSPVYVLSDIHGNIKDLISYEQRLWRSAPVLMPSNLLFLGNYVDQGDYSIEVVLYLFSMKILCPTQVFLLRGIHELRKVQISHTFRDECYNKYGESKGLAVFESVNKCFDCMPFAAVVDETIFCCHGGIPRTVSTIKRLMRAPVELKDPEVESAAVHEILYSDPMEKEDYDKIVHELRITSDTGFISNQKRGMGFNFSKKALDYFLKTNNLSHVIRGHELNKRGFELYLDGRVVSIFSSTNYCDYGNDGAVVHINSLDDKTGVINIVPQKRK